MKKRILFSLLTGAMLLLAPACAKGGKNSIPTPTPYVSPTAAPATPSPVPTPAPFTEVNLSVFRTEPLQNPNFVRLADVPDSVNKTLLYDETNLVALASYSDKDTGICASCIDLKTGQVTTHHLPDMLPENFDNFGDLLSFTLECADIYDIGDYFIINNAVNSRLLLYDRAWNCLDQWSYPTTDIPFSCQTSSDSVLLWQYPEHSLTKFSVKDNRLVNEKHGLAIPEGHVLIEIHPVQNGSDLMLTTYEELTDPDGRSSVGNEFYFLYNLDSDTYHELRLEHTPSYSFSGNKLMAYEPYPHYTTVYDAENPNCVVRFASPQDMFPIGFAGDRYLFFYRYDVTTGRLFILGYDMETGFPAYDFSIPCTADSMYPLDVESFGNTIFLTLSLGDGINMLVAGQQTPLPAKTGFESLSTSSTYYNKADSLNIIDKIYRLSGIRVYTGDDAVRFNSDYYVLPDNDTEHIHNSLQDLYDVISMFPAGFFQEMLHYSTEYSAIEIYLTKTIRQAPDSYNTLTVAGGFVNTDNDTRRMTVDISLGNLKKTFAHEFMHIIENAIYQKDRQKNDRYEAFQNWERLNPKNFDYAYSYTDYGDGVFPYTGQFYYFESVEDVNDNIYFVDSYATTYLTEDLARVFENLATCSKEDVPLMFQSKPLQAKAAYISACIREAFDCITDDTVLPWEENLNEVLTLDYFRENYDFIH